MIREGAWEMVVVDAEYPFSRSRQVFYRVEAVVEALARLGAIGEEEDPRWAEEALSALRPGDASHDTGAGGEFIEISTLQ